MAEKAAKARRKRRIQVGLASVLAVAVLGGLTVFFWNVIASNVGEEEPAAAEREAAGDGAPVESVHVESASITDPAPLEDGSTECDFIPAGEEQLTANPSMVDVGVPDAEQPSTGTQTLTLETNHGVVEMELDAEEAPCAAANFTHLVGEGFYDDTYCHRLVNEGIFVLQCGDPSVDAEDKVDDGGRGGPTYSFVTENEPEDTFQDLSEDEQAEYQSNPQGSEAAPEPNYPAGTLALANSGASGADPENPELIDTNGSQFFLVYEDSYLPPNYTIAGEMTEGLDVVREIAEAGADKPVEVAPPAPGGAPGGAPAGG